MMKKYILYITTWMVTSLFIACSAEKSWIPSDGQGVEVEFSIGLENQAQSRSIADGETATELLVRVFDSSMNELPALAQTKKMENKSATVTFRLVDGQRYNFLFWAQKAGSSYYILNGSNVTVKYESNANDEGRDAFYNIVKDFVVGGQSGGTIELRRPFAQLNIGTTKDDAFHAAGAGFGTDALQSKITMINMPNTFEAFSGNVSGSEVIDFTLAKVPDSSKEELIVKENDVETAYEYVSMNYLLVPKEKMTTNITATFVSDNSEVPIVIAVPNVPLQRNYRTNILGDILTEQVVFNIVVEEEFYQPDYIYPIN